MSARQRIACGLGTLALVLLTQLLLGGGSAHALAAPTPWDGVNPFACTIQDAGQGTTVPDPGADPYCVRFDKTNQNVTELGLVDFLSKEPARVAAAVPKCFYYQEDHWRGSIVQSDQGTVVYEFFGHYFFNKATGDGGVWVTGFTLAGQTFDPRTLPGFPPQWDPYFGPGTGGVISHNDVPVDPSCAAQAGGPPSSPAGSPVYAAPPLSAPHCASASGRVTRSGLGAVRLGMREPGIRARLGPPESLSARRHVLRYCLTRGGSLLVAQRGHRAVLLMSTSHGFALRGPHGRALTVGTTARRLSIAFPHCTRLLTVRRVSFVKVLAPVRSGRGGVVIAGIIHGRIAYLGAYDPGAVPTVAALSADLRAAA
jgi:hypothetical protein